MNHDPLCSFRQALEDDCLTQLYDDSVVCECDLITKVRSEYVNINCLWAVGECTPSCPSCECMDEFVLEREAGFQEAMRQCINLIESIVSYVDPVKGSMLPVDEVLSRLKSLKEN